MELVKIALAVVAGAGGVVALVVALRKQRLNEAEDRRKQADSEREQSKLFNERFGRASEQLGSERAAVRLAGVHALAALADDWPSGRQMCVSVVCSYLKMPYSAPSQSRLPWKRENADERSREQSVRATVVDVIATHLRSDAASSWSGYDFDFSGGTIDLANFSGCVFNGTKVSFAGANFPVGGFVDFRECVFSSEIVDFADASFTGASVDFTGSRITGGCLQFVRTIFRAGVLSFVRIDIDDGWIDFNFASFEGAELAFNATEVKGGGIQFSGARLSVGELKLYYAKATGGLVNFAGVQATGGRVNLEGFNSVEPDKLRMFRCNLDAANPNYHEMDPLSYPPDFSDI